jgi:hypothetical protein
MEQQRKFNLDDYETVEERIFKFWAQYPDGRIDTHMVMQDGVQFIFAASLYRNGDEATLPFATGYAQEIVGQGMVNKTSALENCETSAIGRALANAGFATKGKRASREEMGKVQRGTTTPEIKKAKVARSADQTTEALAEAYVQTGLATDAEQLKKIWADHNDILDVDYQDTTLRSYIMQRKDEVTA